MPATAPMMSFLLPAPPVLGADCFAKETGIGCATIGGFSAGRAEETGGGGGNGGTAFFPAGGIYQEGFSASAGCPTGVGSGKGAGAGGTETGGIGGCTGDGGGTGVGAGAAVS